MKYWSLIYLCILASSNNLIAQQTANAAFDKIQLGFEVVAGESGTFSVSYISLLESRMSEMITRSGFGSNNLSARFVFATKPQVRNTSVTQTTPSMVVTELDLSLAIGDAVDGTLYSSRVITLKGVGRNTEQSLRNTLNSLNQSSGELQEFIASTKDKITSFYVRNCDSLVRNASHNSNSGNYDLAIFMLTSIPDVDESCTNKIRLTIIDVTKQRDAYRCKLAVDASNIARQRGDFEKAISEIEQVFSNPECFDIARNELQKVVEWKCVNMLGKAETAWSQGDITGAANIISEIPTIEACAMKTYSFVQKIRASVDKEKKVRMEIELERTRNDQEIRRRRVTLEEEIEKRRMNLAEERTKGEMNNEMNRIEAARQVGLAYANNQTRARTNTSGWFR